MCVCVQTNESKGRYVCGKMTGGGRDLAPSLSLWADPAFESCGARPTHTDGLQPLRRSSFIICLLLPVQFIWIQRTLILKNSNRDFSESCLHGRLKWWSEIKLKNMNNLSKNIFPFRPQQTNTATQSVHACPRRAKNTALLRFFADTWGCGRARHQIAYNNRTKQLSCFGHIVQEQYDARWFGHLRCCPCLEIRKCRKNEKKQNKED